MVLFDAKIATHRHKEGSLRSNSALKPGSVSRSSPTHALALKREELARARSAARAWAQSLEGGDRSAHAAGFAQAAMVAFAAVAAPSLALSGSPSDNISALDATACRLAESIGCEAACLPLLEGCHFLTSLYTTLLPVEERSELGAFYTPASLSKRLVDLAEEGGIDWATARVLDPASGGGAFLLEAASRMRKALEGSEPAFILAQLGARLSGMEIDPDAASLSQMALEIFLADLTATSGCPAPQFIKVCDTLEATPSPSFDLVLGNPPYGRVRLSAAQRSRFARSLYGHANLYGVFTDIALRWTKAGGVIAYLTPTSVLGGQYYTALRRLLATEAPPEAIDFVHARRGVFEDVMQETLLALYRKSGEPRPYQVHYLHVDNERDARLTKNGKVRLPRDVAAPWLAPRQPAHVELIAAAEQMPARLSDWGYRVSTGPLVWNRFKSQLRERTVRGSLPLIWAEAVTANGRFVFRALKKNHAPFFKVEPGDDWLVVDEASILVQRTTAKEQARRLIAAELPWEFIEQHGGVIVENHLNMVRPGPSPKISPATVAAVLNSDVVDQLFRCISGSVAVSAFELEAIPLPAITEMVEFEQLVGKGASRARLEESLRRSYGLKA